MGHSIGDGPDGIAEEGQVGRLVLQPPRRQCKVRMAWEGDLGGAGCERRRVEDNSAYLGREGE